MRHFGYHFPVLKSIARQRKRLGCCEVILPAWAKCRQHLGRFWEVSTPSFVATSTPGADVRAHFLCVLTSATSESDRVPPKAWNTSKSMIFSRPPYSKSVKFCKLYESFTRMWGISWNSDKISSTLSWKTMILMRNRYLKKNAANLWKSLTKIFKNSEFGAVQRNANLVDLEKCYKFTKWAFGRYRSCRYSRERASQNLRVISFIVQSTP